MYDYDEKDLVIIFFVKDEHHAEAKDSSQAAGEECEDLAKLSAGETQALSQLDSLLNKAARTRQRKHRVSQVFNNLDFVNIFSNR